jgi:uncharacterized protein YndB with AHSA1/START domain
MASRTETTSIQREVQIDASPATVWEFLVDPEKAVRWMGDLAELDPQPGGLYRVRVIPSHVARGEFVELDPPHRVVFTWGWEESSAAPSTVPPGASTIEIELEPHDGGTLLKFTHRDLPSAESVESHGHGWDHYLTRLATAAAGGDPGRDEWLDQRG